MRKRFSLNRPITVFVESAAATTGRIKRGLMDDQPQIDYLPRRKGEIDVIIPYDLAQINTGTQETPVWSDHPIIKTPTYTASLTAAHVDYHVEDFTSTDYQNFTDSLFDLGPVEEWKNIFRKMDLIPQPSPSVYLEEYPVTISVESPVTTNLFAVMTGATRIEDITTPEGKEDRLEMLTDLGLCWDSRGLEYRNLEILHYSSSGGFGTGNLLMEWYSFNSGDDSIYKITETYDSSAADVMADLEFKGRIELYLIPMPCLYFAVGALSADNNNTDGFNVMFAYQVLPRKSFPTYADPLNLLSNDERTSNFLDYQKMRADMVASHWFESAPGVITETSIDPTTFMAGVESYGATATNSSRTDFYDEAPGGTIETRSLQTSDRFNRDGWLLGAVMKLKGRFYYLWCHEGLINTIADNTNPYAIRSSDYPI